MWTAVPINKIPIVTLLSYFNAISANTNAILAFKLVIRSTDTSLVLQQKIENRVATRTDYPTTD